MRGEGKREGGGPRESHIERECGLGRFGFAQERELDTLEA